MKMIIAALILFTYSSALGATDRTLDGKFIKNGSATLTLPTATTTIIGNDTTDTLTNKTITAPSGLVKGDVGLSSVDDVQQLPLSYLDTDNTLAADSDTKVPSQKAIKAYVGSLGVDIVNDTSPQLGGNLDANAFDIYLGSGQISQNLSQASLSFPSASSVKLQQTPAGNSLLIDSDSIDLDAGANEIEALSNIDMQTTKKVVNLADGTASGDAVNKGQLDLKADLASPALSGNPTAPTQSANDNSTKIATTAYVDAAVSAGGSAPFTSGTNGSPILITAAGGIGFNSSNSNVIMWIAGDSAPINITANPQILGSAGAITGQTLTLISKSATNTVTLEDGTGVSLNGAWVGGLDSIIELVFDGTNWSEKSRR